MPMELIMGSWVEPDLEMADGYTPPHSSLITVVTSDGSMHAALNDYPDDDVPHWTGDRGPDRRR